MERWAGKSAIVTGAASGIGQAITIALLKKGVNVLALDIQTEKLSDLLKYGRDTNWGTICVMRCNISDETDLKCAFDYLENNVDESWKGGVHIMVNNAGVIEYTRVIESDRAAFERLLNINVLATAVCINRAVRSMRQRNVEGHIFNINSVLGHEIPSGFLSEIDGCNGWNLYPTCKHGNVALTHTVRRELAAIKAPIRITSISPGIVETDIAGHTPTISERLKNIPALRPEDIADAVIYALGTRPEVQLVGDHNERRCSCDLDHRQRPRHSRRIDTEVGNDGRRIGRGRVRDWSDGLSTDDRHSVIIVTGSSCVFEPATIYSQRKPFFSVLKNYNSVDRDSVHERGILSRSLSIVRVSLDLQLLAPDASYSSGRYKIIKIANERIHFLTSTNL